jgi:hypothetical protein
MQTRSAWWVSRVVDLNALIEEALNLAYHAARARDASFNITFEREFDRGLAPTELAPQEMTQVFLQPVRQRLLQRPKSVLSSLADYAGLSTRSPHDAKRRGLGIKAPQAARPFRRAHRTRGERRRIPRRSKNQ